MSATLHVVDAVAGAAGATDGGEDRVASITHLNFGSVTADDVVRLAADALGVAPDGLVLRTAEGLEAPGTRTLLDAGLQDGGDVWLAPAASSPANGTSPGRGLPSPSRHRDAAGEPAQSQQHRGGATEFQLDVVVQEAPGRPVYRLTGAELATMSVGELKATVEPVAGVPAAIQRLFIGNRMRRDDEALTWCLRGTDDVAGVPPLVRCFKEALSASVYLPPPVDVEYQVHDLRPHDTLVDVRRALRGVEADLRADGIKATFNADKSRFRPVLAADVSPSKRNSSDNNKGGAGHDADRRLGPELPDDATLSSLRTSRDGGVLRLAVDDGRGSASSSGSPGGRTAGSTVRATTLDRDPNLNRSVATDVDYLVVSQSRGAAGDVAAAGEVGGTRTDVLLSSNACKRWLSRRKDARDAHAKALKAAQRHRQTVDEAMQARAARADRLRYGQYPDVNGGNPVVTLDDARQSLATAGATASSPMRVRVLGDASPQRRSAADAAVLGAAPRSSATVDATATSVDIAALVASIKASSAAPGAYRVGSTRGLGAARDQSAPLVVDL